MRNTLSARFHVAWGGLAVLAILAGVMIASTDVGHDSGSAVASRDLDPPISPGEATKGRKPVRPRQHAEVMAARAAADEAAARAIYDPGERQQEIALRDAPVFARPDVPLRLKAVAPTDSTTVQLYWDGPSGSGSVAMVEQRSHGAPLWRATIPSDDLQPGRLSLRVSASFAQGARTSRTYFVKVASEVRRLRPRERAIQATSIGERPWGTTEDALGVEIPEADGETLGPPAFAVDPARGRIHVLDAVNQRVLSMSLDGEVLGRVGLPTRTSTDIVIDPTSGEIFVTDPSHQAVFRISEGEVRHTYYVPGIDSLPANAQYVWDPLTRSLLVNDSAGRAALPVVVDGAPVQPTQSAPVPWPLEYGFEGRALFVELPGTAGQVAELSFPQAPIGLQEIVVDGQGMLWARLMLADGKGARECLAWVDPTTGGSGFHEIPSSTLGASTRRLAPVDQGVVLLEDGDAGARFVLYAPA